MPRGTHARSHSFVAALVKQAIQERESGPRNSVFFAANLPSKPTYPTGAIVAHNMDAWTAEKAAEYAARKAAAVIKMEEYYNAELRLPKLVDNAWDHNKHKAICSGSTALIMIIDEKTVFKSSLAQHSKRDDPWDLHHFQMLETERLVYRRLGQHPRICSYHRDVRWGLVLERHPTSVTFVLRELKKSPSEMLDASRVLKWSIQLAEGLSYIHSKGVLHFDISCNNMLITKEDDLLLCDFGGSSIDLSQNIGFYDVRYSKEDEPAPTPTSMEYIKWEVFALGCAIYEMSTGLKPYADLSDSEVEKLFKQRTFPNVDALALGEFMRRCWHGKYKTAEAVAQDLRRLRSQNINTPEDDDVERRSPAQWSTPAFIGCT